MHSIARQKIAILDDYMTIGQMTAGVRTTTATVHRAVYRTDRHLSVNLCLSQRARTTTTNRTVQNSSFVRSGKSEEEVHELLTEDCSRHIVPLKLTTDRHEASRGITATAGLLVRLRDRSTELSHQPPVSLHNSIPAISIPVY